MTLYQFIPYPENKPEKEGRYTIIDREGYQIVLRWMPALKSFVFASFAVVSDGYVTSFLAPVPVNPDDEKAAAEWAINNRYEHEQEISKQAFLAGCTHKALQHQQWKKEAMQVMPDFQEIGRIIGVPHGQSVHDKIVPWIKRQLQQNNSNQNP